MKDLKMHYLVLLLPLVIVILVEKYLPSSLFIVLILSWAIIYHPLITGRRLYKKGIIGKPKWVAFLYFRPKWFKEVYFKR